MRLLEDLEIISAFTNYVLLQNNTAIWKQSERDNTINFALYRANLLAFLLFFFVSYTKSNGKLVNKSFLVLPNTRIPFLIFHE